MWIETGKLSVCIAVYRVTITTHTHGDTHKVLLKMSIK